MEPWTIKLVAKRPRRRVQKSFSGCAKCKARKIKCDETKPNCLRCIDNGELCPGFPTGVKLRWSKQQGIHSMTPNPSKRSSEPLKRQSTRKSLSTVAQMRFEATAIADFDIQALSSSPGAITVYDTPVGAKDLDPSCDLSPTVTQNATDDSRQDINYSFSLDENSGILSGDGALLMSLECFPSTTKGRLQPGPANDPLMKVLDANLTVVDDQIANDLDSSASPSFCHATDCSDEIDDIVISIRSTWPGAPEASLLYNRDNLPLALEHLPTKLVEAYFTLVCPLFSTYDSEQNVFRSFADRQWQNSGPMFYAMLSMTAAKLGRQKPHLRSHALEYQSLVHQSLCNRVSEAKCWDTELLFVILMLGLSTSWHDAKDLGLVHLKTMQHAIRNCAIECLENSPPLEFFIEALVYWEMVTCFLDQGGSVHSYSMRCETYQTPTVTSCGLNSMTMGHIKPHVWTGVVSMPQVIFTRIIRHIQQIGSLDQSSTAEFRRSLNNLVEQLWSLELPSLYEIANTGDENTPAIHHLLIAEAYMFANFYQLYHTFPYLRRMGAERILEQDVIDCSTRRSWAQSQVGLRSFLNSRGDPEDGLLFMGRNIITRLEQIQVSSGTSCVQPLLLLVASASLSVTPGLESGELASEILRMRKFVLERLSYFSLAFLSEPMNYVRLVVLEIFKRLDVGVKVSWMDVLHSVGLATIIG